MNLLRNIVATFSLLTTFIFTFPVVHAAVLPTNTMTVEEQLNVHVMMEVMLNGMGMIGQSAGSVTRDITWTGNYNASGFSASVNGSIGGEAFNLSYTGATLFIGGFAQQTDIVGNGTLGSKDITSASSAVFAVDALGDYSTFTYEDRQLFTETNPTLTKAERKARRKQRWIKAAEILGGGVIGFLGGGGPVGAIEGAAAGLALSKEIQSSASGNDEPVEPVLPAYPDQVRSEWAKDMVIPEGFIMTYVDGSGALFGNNGGSLLIDGTWSSGTASGVASISAVPIPAAVWFFGSGLIGLLGFAKCKSN